MRPDQKEQLFNNYKAAMEGVPVEIVKRQIAHCYRADPAYGAGVAKAMGIDFKPQTIAAE
jgi:catalase